MHVLYEKKRFYETILCKESSKKMLPGKSILKQNNKNAGFSMIEVLAAMAAAAVVVMGTMKMAGDVSKSGVGAETAQQRTSLDQELTAVFDNPDNCIRTLAGVASVENASVNISALGVLDSTKVINSTSTDVSDHVAPLDHVSLRSITLTNVSADLGSGTHRAVVAVVGDLQNSVKGNGAKQVVASTFNINIPVYYVASGGVITSCLSTKSPYSSCMALNGTWTGSNCDFCSNLGGTRQATGVCSLFVKPPPPPPPVVAPVATVTPPPAAPSGGDGSTVVAVMSRSLYNGYNDDNLGAHKWCALTNYSYDGDGIGECTVTQKSDGTWNVHIGDEGTAQPQLCYITCADGGSTQVTGATNDGAMCTYGGKMGIMLGGCCSTGTQFKINFTSNNKNSFIYTGTTNDIGCH